LHRLTNRRIFADRLDYSSESADNQRRGTEMLAADNHPPRIAAPGLDQVDLGLIRLLQADGRASQEELAREVGLSRPAVHERLRKLEQHGVIQGYTVHVDWSAVGLPILAFILVRTTGRCAHSTAEIAAVAERSAFIEEVHRVTGDFCFLVKARAASSAALEALIDRIRDVPGVRATHTTLALSTMSGSLGLAHANQEQRVAP
jgi:Lrp/AsnC family leucine-responsive transcriptional regulator